jgi:single-strand DNA-binding protein
MSDLLVEGNITGDVIERYTPSGVLVVEFGVAENRTVEQNGVQVQKPDFYDVKVWRKQGENCALSLKKGDRVIVKGRLERRSWTDETTGQTRVRFDLIADCVGASLRFAKVDITKTSGRGAVEPVTPAGEPVGEEPF